MCGFNDGIARSSISSVRLRLGLLALTALLLLSSSTRASWHLANTAPEWGPNSDYRSVVFNGSIYIGGGQFLWEQRGKAPTWKSRDGTSWNEVLPYAAWIFRDNHEFVVHDERLWMLGGGGRKQREIWSTADGMNWELISNEAPYGTRAVFACTEFAGSMWLFGGWTYDSGYGGGFRRDVWTSSDGVNWNQVTSFAPWKWRTRHRAVAFKGRMWLMGGFFTPDQEDVFIYYNDVWRSRDGQQWEEVTSAAPWKGRQDAQLVVYHDKMWIFGGDMGQTPLWDMWCSEDGKNWEQVESRVPWAGRYALSSVVFDDKIWLFSADADTGPTTQVWYFDETTEGEGEAEGEGEPSCGPGAPLPEPCPPGIWHTADQDHDTAIALTELLRLVQFFNSGGLHCAENPSSTEDGYVPGPNQEAQSCTPHNSDYWEPGSDWSINLSELLRLVQFFNSGSYGCDAGSEDGFAPAPMPCEEAGEGEGEGEVDREGEGEGEGDSFEGDLPEVLTETILLPGGIPLDMVWISPGVFLMGRYPGEQASYSEDEGPQHQVTLTQGYWIGKYEVTQAQWEAVMHANPSYFLGGDRPVEQVSWDDVQSFITALNQATGRAFRLPTEAEWEYACRAGSATRFYWGDDPNYTSLGSYAWYERNSGGQTHEVGRRRPNAWGLFDMSGNVSEWVQDWYGTYTDAPVTDPAGPSSGTFRTVRNGAYHNHHWLCRSAYRSWGYAHMKFKGRGFRLAM